MKLSKDMYKIIYPLAVITVAMNISAPSFSQVGASSTQKRQLPPEDYPDSFKTKADRAKLKTIFAQEEEEFAKARVRPGRGRIARYLWCRLGPEGGSRETCSEQANE